MKKLFIILILFTLIILSSCTPSIVNKCIDKCSPAEHRDWLWKKYCGDYYTARGEDGVKEFMNEC